MQETLDLDTARLTMLASIRRVGIAILLILIGNALYVTQDVVMPLVLGYILALTLRPIVQALVRRGLPAPVAAVVIVPIVAMVVGAAAYGLSSPFSQLVASAPTIGRELTLKFAEYRDEIETLSEASRQVEEIASGAADATTQRVVVEQPALLTTAATSAMSIATTVVVALIFATLLLSTGTMFYEKLIGVMPALSEKKRALRTVRDVERQVSRYLLTITLINICLGLVVSAALYLVGMPNPLLWGALAVVLNYLPFLGALAGTLALAAYAIVTYHNIGDALLPPVIYIILHLIEGNVVTPWIVGRRLELNAVAVFIAVAVWGWLWGVAGALLAVPILVVVKVLCDNSDSWAVLGEFLSGRRQPEEE